MTRKPVWREYGEALVLAFCLAMLIRFFVVQAYQIPSGSMLNTLLIGDKILVSRLSYNVKIPFTDRVIFRLGDPAVGDIIVFTFPDPNPDNARIDYIKRVIGLPGDVIEARDNKIYRNGEALDEPYVRLSGSLLFRSGVVHPGVFVRGNPHNFAPITVPEDHYFALGDNRNDSLDSRFWGFVPRDFIQGKAWRVYWSWGDKAGDAGSSGFADSGPRWGRIGSLVE
ncbi:MAG: signal peptidase I [Desulfovibrionaceae bacterium]|nr:signal peptidase I [Desulfovibrionaceae bacterium]